MTFLVLVLGAISCATPRPTPVPATPPTEPEAALGPGDAFEVTVYGQPDLSGKYRVNEDGNINFPLVGRVEVGGKAPGAIASELKAALAEKQILRDPQVSVYLLERTSKHISVMGAVARPGSFPLANGMSVIQAISAAGGLKAIAAGNRTIVTRNQNGKLQRFAIDVDRISEGRAEDFKLQDGDIVFVPDRIF